MPLPVSPDLDLTASPSARAVRTVTVPSGGVWRIAFWMRLKQHPLEARGVGVRERVVGFEHGADGDRRRLGLQGAIASTVSRMSSSSATCCMDHRSSPLSQARQLEEIVR